MGYYKEEVGKYTIANILLYKLECKHHTKGVNTVAVVMVTATVFTPSAVFWSDGLTRR